MWEVTIQKDSILQRDWHACCLRQWGAGGFAEALSQVERGQPRWAEKAAVWLGD